MKRARGLQPNRKLLRMCCPEPHLHRHGFYKRKSPMQGDFWILRFLCVNCRQTISLLPLFFMPLKQHDTDTIFSALEAYYLGIDDLETLCESLDIVASTMYRWVNDFEYNAVNFGLSEYQIRLLNCYGRRLKQSVLAKASTLFLALKELVDIGQDRQDSPSSNIRGNFFFHLQEALGSPQVIDEIEQPILGIFRKTLDRGG